MCDHSKENDRTWRIVQVIYKTIHIISSILVIPKKLFTFYSSVKEYFLMSMIEHGLQIIIIYVLYIN